MGEGETEVERLPGRGRHACDARGDSAAGCAVERSPRSAEPWGLRRADRGVGLRAARRGDAARQIDVGNAGTLLRILPGWLAGQGAGSWVLDGDESIRRRPVDRVAEPLRLMGAEVECRDGRLPPLRVDRRGAARDRLPAAGGERPGEVVRAARRAAGRGRDPGHRAGPDPGSHRAHAARGRRAGRVAWTRGQSRSSAAARPAGSPSGRRSASSPGGSRCPATSPRRPSWWSRRRSFRAARCGSRAVGLNPTRVGLLGILNRMGAAVEVEEERLERRRAARDRRRPPRHAARRLASTPRRCRSRSTSCRWSRCWAASPRAGPWSRGPRSSATRSPTGSRAWSRGCGGSALRSRRPTTASWSTGRAARGGALDSRGDHRLAMLGRDRRPRLARGGRGGGTGGGGGQLPGVRPGPRLRCSCRSA